MLESPGFEFHQQSANPPYFPDRLSKRRGPPQLERATAEEVTLWAEDWRRHRSGPALSALYHRFITCIPERKVPMQFLINLLGSPDYGDPFQVYYGLNPDSGLVLIADSDGFLEGRKLN
jgi:hypothetical protein